MTLITLWLSKWDRTLCEKQQLLAGFPLRPEMFPTEDSLAQDG